MTRAEDEKIARVALRLASARGWKGVTFAAISREAKIPTARLSKRFSAPEDLIPLIVGEVSHQSLPKTVPRGGPFRDVLFDLLMERFDVLQKDRRAVISIAREAKKNTHLLCRLACATAKAMEKTAKAATGQGTPSALWKVSLPLAYMWAFNSWIKDETRDMAKTMAALDKALKLAEEAANAIRQRS